MAYQVQIIDEREMAIISHVSYFGVAREQGKIKVRTKYRVALLTCFFFLLISLALAIWFGYQGHIWLSIAAVGPFFASLMAALCVKVQITK